MLEVQILTVITVMVIVIYGLLINRLLIKKEMSFYRQALIISPGAIVIVLLYAWLVLGFSLGELAVFLIIGIAIFLFYAVFMKTTADLIKKHISKK